MSGLGWTIPIARGLPAGWPNYCNTCWGSGAVILHTLQELWVIVCDVSCMTTRFWQVIQLFFFFCLFIILICDLSRS